MEGKAAADDDAGLFMTPAVLLIDPSDVNMRMMAQVGVESLVATYPGHELEPLAALVARADTFGMGVSVIERFWPHDKIVHGLEGSREQIDHTKVCVCVKGGEEGGRGGLPLC